MINKKSLSLILKKVTEEMKQIFGDKLITVLLYGSYARGDNKEDSDIDIFVIVNMEKLALSRYRTQVSNFASRIDLQYDTFLSIKLQDQKTYVYFLDVLPFYKNVASEGISLLV